MSAAELTEAADFLEANGWLPTTLGTPAVEAVTTPLLPGDKGRIVAALREAARQAAPVIDPDSPEAWAQIEARQIRLWTGPVTVGLWCPTCLLPSGYKVPFHRDTGGKPWLTVRRCIDNPDHRPTEEPRL